MRPVFCFSRSITVWLLVVVMLAPAAFASGTTRDAGLWAEFVMWLASRLDVPGGLTAPDEDSFTVWLMSRWTIPGG